MKVSIVGFGKMGNQILSVLNENKDEVVSIIDLYSKDPRVTSKSLSKESLNGAEVVIDFSSPETILDNIDFYINENIAAVIGTTGWQDHIKEVEGKVKKNSKILYSSNYSLGVAVFLLASKKLSELVGKTDLYDVAIFESHHNEKKDSPSGTALMLAESILPNMPKKEKILIGNSQGKIKEDELQISSMRVGYESGFHEIVFDSPSDTIKFSHHARNRKGFATGAVKAASWLINTDKSGLLTMDDFINELLK